MVAKRLTERVNQAPFAGGGTAVDEQAGVIRGAGLCGLVSENARDYPLAVQQRDCGKYDGAKVFFDHTDERTGRKFHDWVGVVRRPECVASGSRGDIEVFLSDPHVPKLLEALRKCPEKFGMSHVAMCKTRVEGGREVVESIDTVESVDIVLNPATNPAGFFRRESKGSTVKISLKQFVERFGPKWGAKRWASATQLCEDMGDAAGAPVMDEPAADASPEDLQTGLMAALQPMLADAFETGNSDKACAALRDFVKLHAKHTGKAATEPEAKPEPTGEGKKKSSADGTASIREAIAVCQKVGFKGFDADDLELIERTPAEKREAVARRLMGTAAGAERPESGDRHRTTKIDEQKLREDRGGGGDKPPSGAKEFGKWLSE